MSEERNLDAVWDDGWSIGVLAAVAAPILAVWLVAPEITHAPEIADVSGVVSYVVVLFADLLIYLHWRMTRGPAGWLVLGLTALAVQSLALAGLMAADPTRAMTHPGWMVFVQILVALGLFGLVATAQRRRQLRVDPILAGGAVGLVVVVLRQLLITYTDPVSFSDATLRVLDVVVLAIDLAIAVALFRLTIAPAWVRVRLGAAVALLSLGHAASYPAPDGMALSIVTSVTNILGAAVLLSLAIALVRLSWMDNRAALDLLSRQVERIEAGARVEQARLHEIRATVAGVSTASRLIHESTAVSGAHRRRIEEMIDSEMDRLQRLLSDQTSDRPAPVDLDATIRPIVIRHQTRGYPIAWNPTGQRAIARADDVAEVVNVLLENAVQHAPGAGASVETRRSGGIVEIAISDTGPGVDRAVRSRIFDWGERGQRSPGSGIGLNVAKQLTAELGGYLRLVDSSAPGATFVLGLPAEESS
jgi:signal transduction histidine kinase